jgi:hypothetical protein
LPLTSAALSHAILFPRAAREAVVFFTTVQGWGGPSQMETAMTKVQTAILRCPAPEEPNKTFEAMLPTIQRVASYGFRRCSPGRREQLVADVVARSFLAFVALLKRGKAALAYPTVLAKYAIRQVRDGRQVGCPQNVNDVLSPLAQIKKGFTVQSLSRRSGHAQWEELINDFRATPPDVAAFRIDFREWLSRLPPIRRQIALRLASGDTTSEASRYFRVTRARISQVRAELLRNWNAYQSAPA